MITMKSKEDSLTSAIASPICTNLSRYPMAVLRLSGELETVFTMESTVATAAGIKRWETVSSFCMSDSKRSMFILELSIAGLAVGVAMDGLGCSLRATATMDSLGGAAHEITNLAPLGMEEDSGDSRS
jgi:hypothetical protein